MDSHHLEDHELSSYTITWDLTPSSNTHPDYDQPAPQGRRVGAGRRRPQDRAGWPSVGPRLAVVRKLWTTTMVFSRKRIRPHDGQSAISHKSPRGVLAAVSLATLAVAADAAGFGASTATISGYLELSSVGLTIVMSAYSLAAAVGLIVAGGLSDRLGRRRVLRAGAAIAIVGLGLSVLAFNGLVLSGGRALIGFGSGLITVSALAAVSDAYPESRRTRAYAIVSVVGAVDFWSPRSWAVSRSNCPGGG